MGDDPGLRPDPWVSIELREGRVFVDGKPVPVTGPPEDQYLLALHRVAEEVAAPLGRRVGVTVSDTRGVVTHLALDPDGNAESIEDLVRAASAPTFATATATAAAQPSPDVRTRRRRIRPVGLAAATAVLLVALAVGAATVLSPTSGRSEEREPADPPGAAVAGPARAPARSATRVVVTPRWREPRLALVADLAPGRRGRVVLLVGATAPRARVHLRLRPASGAVVRRTVVLHGRIRRLVLDDLAGGVAAWRITARGARALTGTVAVRRPAPPTAPTTVPVSAVPSSGTPSRHRPHRHRTPQAAPTVPIDPDDQ